MSLVIALGGNAIVSSSRRFQDQYQNIYQSMSKIALLIKEGYKVVITHGNGPQVGDALLRHEIAKEFVPSLPLFACVAETQGLLGFMIEYALRKRLFSLNIKPKIATLISMTRVSKTDPAFSNPTKPIGPFYSEEEMLKISKINSSMKFIKIGSKYRRVVPSPDPIEIVEADAVKDLIDDNFTVITAGGGGIPIEDNFIDAVVDKDLASERLATSIGVSKLIFLTDVPGVYINYANKNRILLKNISVDELKMYLNRGEFGKGSMEPKVLASIKFVTNTRNEAVITDIRDILNAVNGKRGTIIRFK